MFHLTTIYEQFKADLLLTFLRAHGIDAKAFSDNARGYEPQLTSLHGVKIWVPETQKYRAQTLLEEYDSGDHSIDESFDPGSGEDPE